MKQFILICFSTLILTITLVINSPGQCAAESNSSVNFSPLIFSGAKNGDCGKSKFYDSFNNIFGLSKTERPFENSSGSTGGLEVDGRPDLTFVSYPGNDSDGGYQEGVHRVTLQITCSGASSPRISWGATHLYYAQPYEERGEKIEFPGFIGLGEKDGENSVVMKSEDRSEGGARVFPWTEQISCLDLDHRENSKTLKDVVGDTRLIPPSLYLIGDLHYASPSDHPELDPNDKRFAKDTDEEFDKLHIPVGKLVTICLRLNINPMGNEGFQLIQGTPSEERFIHTYKEKDPRSFNPCETMSFDEVGTYVLYLRMLPYKINSKKILFKAVDK